MKRRDSPDGTVKTSSLFGTFLIPNVKSYLKGKDLFWSVASIDASCKQIQYNGDLNATKYLNESRVCCALLILGMYKRR